MADPVKNISALCVDSADVGFQGSWFLRVNESFALPRTGPSALLAGGAYRRV